MDTDCRTGSLHFFNLIGQPMNQTRQTNASHTFLAAHASSGCAKSAASPSAPWRKLGVTDKAVSKWESGRGLPDISLVEPLAQRLGISVAELLAGDIRANANRAGNMLKGVFYVCPICGNVVHALGEGSFSCCGSTMFPQEPKSRTRTMPFPSSASRTIGTSRSIIP